MATLVFFKIIFLITIVFFSYIAYFGYTEYKAFSGSEDYKNSSVFEKLIIRTLLFLGSSSLLTIIFSYLYLLFYSSFQ
jgi:hypothetical protein